LIIYGIICLVVLHNGANTRSAPKVSELSLYGWY